jgi:hypothetical protein
MEFDIVKNVRGEFLKLISEISKQQSRIDTKWQFDLMEWEQSIKRWGGDLDAETDPFVISTKSYVDLRTQKNERYSDGLSVFVDKRDMLLSVKNRRYQWLLAEAYEFFEDAIEKLYAAAGYLDRDFWPLSDFGHERLSTMENLGFDDFQKKAVKKRDTPKSILAVFKNRIPSLESADPELVYGAPVGFLVVLVEKLRHLIVHSNGRTDRLDEFCSKVFQDAGISSKGKDADLELYIRKLFAETPIGDYQIHLLEPELDSTELELPEDTFIIRQGFLDDLLSVMMSYVALLADTLLEHLERSAYSRSGA